MNEHRELSLSVLNHTTLQLSRVTELANISLSNTSQAVTSSNNLLAYRPRFADVHSSNLAGVFINLEGVFSCLESLRYSYHPICQVFSEEGDGFRKGKALIGAGDYGNDIRVFSSTSNVLTYGVAIQECPEFIPACFPTYHSSVVVCYLPRAVCS